MENIKDKVVVITGASSGMGAATARKLARLGAKVVLGARREERLKGLVEELGGNAIYVKTDVSKKADVDNLIFQAIAAFGKIDVLWNNAGIMPVSFFDEGKLDEWERMIDINIKGIGYPGILSLRVSPALSSLFDSLVPYIKSDRPLSEVMKRHKLEETIHILLEQEASLQQCLFDFADPGKADLREFMLRNYMFNIPMNKFAELTGRSLSTFQRDFFKIFGMKASHWLLKRRLQAAHEALNSGHKRPSDVYLEFGFGDMSHFSKVFKSEYGYSPSFLNQKKNS